MYYECIYPTPPLQAGCDIKSIFKWSKVGLNSYFLLLDWLPTMAREPSLPLYFYPLLKGKKALSFCPKGFSSKWILKALAWIRTRLTDFMKQHHTSKLELCIYLTSLTWAGCDTKSVFKLSTTSYRAISLMSTVRPGFNLRSSHTKDSKNGTWCCLS